MGMDPKKALMKGIRSITRDEFIEAAKLFAEKESMDDKEFHKEAQLREKYPAYNEVCKMLVTAAKGQEKTVLSHALGMHSAFRILLHIAERK
jgi:hypothetical protein